jgi:NADH:ubiquinone oxidoreductase subunit 2 (subunit N)
MITSVIGAYYYLRIIKIMWFEKPIENRFNFETNMSGLLYEVYVAIEFSLIVFLLWTPWIFSFMNVLTTVAIHPLSQWIWQ